MADGTTKMSQSEANAFWKWLEETYNITPFPGAPMQFRVDDKHYQAWLSAGKPGFKQAQPRQEAMPPPWTSGPTMQMGKQLAGVSGWTPPAQGETPTEELPPAQEGELTDDQMRELSLLPLRQFEFQKMQTDAKSLNELNRLTMENDQMQRELKYLRQQQAIPLSNFTGGIRGKQAKEFEMWRETFLAQRTGPANAVARWVIQHKPNPYAWDVGGGESRSSIEKQGGIESGMSEYQKGYALGVPEEGVGTEISRRQKLSEREGEEGKREYDEAVSLYERGPETPAWLHAFAPNAGQYLNLNKPLNVLTPSGQQLTSMAPSQSQYLAGAIDVLGGRSWQDVLAQAEIQLPKAPQRGRTAWRPPSQGRV